MKRVKTLREYIHANKLNESSLIAKGFAIGQRGRFYSNKSKLDSKISNLKNSMKSGQLNSDQEQQLKAVITGFIQLADIIDTRSDMEANLMNLVIALTLFHEGK